MSHTLDIALTVQTYKNLASLFGKRFLNVAFHCHGLGTYRSLFNFLRMVLIVHLAHIVA